MIETRSEAHEALEQFVLLAKTSKGAALHELIKNVIEANNVFVFGELLAMPNVKELKESSPKYYNLLELFAYGTISDYRNSPDAVPPLSDAAIHKLRVLTLVTLANTQCLLPYTFLQEQLGLDNLRSLEDLVIYAVYENLIVAKLDRRMSHVEIRQTASRDITPQDLDIMTGTLSRWCHLADNVSGDIDDQLLTANEARKLFLDHRTRLAEEVENVKRAIHSTQDVSLSSPMNVENRAVSSTSERSRKSPKVKSSSRATSAKFHVSSTK